MSDNRKVEILLRVAREIANEARDLFRTGSGLGMDPLDTSLDGPGLIDEIDPNSEEYTWMNQVLSFSRFVYHILQFAMATENEDYLIENGEEEI